MMRIDFVSLFPSMFFGPFDDSIIRRARDNGILDIHILNPRDFAFDRHKHVDDSPFGGGSGMVLKPEPMFRALRFLLGTTNFQRRRILLMSPDGEVFSQDKAKELSEELRREVTVQELAEESGLSEKAIRDAIRMSGYKIEGIDFKE